MHTIIYTSEHNKNFNWYHILYDVNGSKYAQFKYVWTMKIGRQWQPL